MGCVEESVFVRMVRIMGGAGRRTWVTGRDERVCEWLSIVRVTDEQAIRWVLGALNSVEGPVSTRRAQTWVARMEVVGLVERTNLGGPGESIVGGTYEATAQGKPNIYRQTTRHEVAVAAVSARYINPGFAWRLDEKPQYVGAHQADGVALGYRSSELIEVELTAKTAPRFASIFAAYRNRLDFGEAGRIAYLCNAERARAVRTALSASPAGRTIAPHVAVREVFDARAGLVAWTITAVTTL